MPEDIIQIQEQYYIRASVSLAETRSHVLKHDNCFAVFDRLGNMRPLGIRDHGLFRDDTRFLSRLVLDLEGKQFLLLSSEVREDKDVLAVDLTNPEFTTSEGQFIGQDTLHILRTTFLWKNTAYERIRVHNYGSEAFRVPITLRFEADFADIFEVRGIRRSQRGEYLPPRVSADAVILSYRGLDGVERQTHLRFSPVPTVMGKDWVRWWVPLQPQEERDLWLTVVCSYAGEEWGSLDYEGALQLEREQRQSIRGQAAQIDTGNAQFNDWLNASRDDLVMMLTQTPHGLYPYAGVPWFSTVFGRDALITALATLWWYPDIARGVLLHLAAQQAQEEDPSRDAEPGKILHEQRRCEMAKTGEIPFGQYYGSIDSTPLFVVLAGRYIQRSGDHAFLQQLWPHIKAALTWMDTYGDPDGDGFVEYVRKAHRGLRNQGWKDSDDSIFYPDGSLAEPPLALCEVQGYVYEAKRLAADMAEALGNAEEADRLRQQARTLQEQFLKHFWCEELRGYALALDGEKKPCRVRSSNMGHCLFSGIADPAHAACIAEQMMQPDFFTGWGIRTVPEGEGRFNPMAYHNGSIWPHDNALIAAGLARYGYKTEAMRVLTGLFDATQFLELKRLPELFCGFTRRQREGPTLYPVACLPQAWASASVFLLLQACLGLEIDGQHQRVSLTRPILPLWLPHVTLRHIAVGEGSLDLGLYLQADGVGINVLGHLGNVEVVVK
ncbi:amylo-alpha-1,6-glucosidase [Thermostichus vulcanus]|uniref:Amylo-alpha-1,6-glucosidase n=1 Tax=Thermostichus vulcanus str. 'Rupite' TaxID=2813851 RepID=A0ABT0C7D8_THEVL|nr:amylo-alpha-1,6-glucosidase [Thermostichus vulcanus]MCJ2541685.1 amylo-alpha-1,6-glucosidase [Thermostichus vulcanus str. 'Rupite']